MLHLPFVSQHHERGSPVVEIGMGPAPVRRGIERACAWPKPGGADN